MEWLVDDSMKPCPETCAVEISEFDVDGIPDARGIRRTQTEEDIAARGRPDDRPFDSYKTIFTDGTLRLHGRSFGESRGRVGGAGAGDRNRPVRARHLSQLCPGRSESAGNRSGPLNWKALKNAENAFSSKAGHFAR